MTKIYLELELGSGRLFQRSKTEQEGYERVVTSNPTTKEEVTSFRKYHTDGVFGSLVGVEKRDNELNGRKLSNLVVHMEEGDFLYHIQVPLKDQRGDFQSYVQSFLSFLPFLKEGVAYRFYPYVIDETAKNPGSKKKYGIAMNYARLATHPEGRAVDKENKIQRLTIAYRTKNDDGTYKEVPGDIPATNWKQVAGEDKADNDAKNEYLHNVLMANLIAPPKGASVATFDSTKVNQQPATAPAAQTEAKTYQTPVGDKPKSAIRPNTAMDTTAATTTAPASVDEMDEEDKDLPF